MSATTPTRAELWTLYRAAVDMCMMQVGNNWTRVCDVTRLSFYLCTLGLGVGLILHHRAIAVTLLGMCSVFAVGGALSIRKGHEYYRNARAEVMRVERALELPGEFQKRITRGDARRGGDVPFPDRLTITNIGIAVELIFAAASATFAIMLR